MTMHEPTSHASLSRRIRRLKQAAAGARNEANAVIGGAAHPLPAAAGIVPGLLGRAGAAGLHLTAGVVRRHPVSAVLIAGVLIGTAFYHRSSRDRGPQL